MLAKPIYKSFIRIIGVLPTKIKFKLYIIVRVYCEYFHRLEVQLVQSVQNFAPAF